MLKPADRDKLLIRLDERTSGLLLAVKGLYGIWGAILLTAIGGVIKASLGK